ncbi:methyl-CpG-binding domain protein 6 isoform X1 [Astyanax mexicanus]|uniref:Methyl-CpG-binding domain protein 6 isoform X1 n=1 Tax=Astyanax mexicanus TaxID=7994 RepID=A0A8B9KSX6_ASTMX|nr:methyl-CpG-binding domain protein 6 isoform X1 [Astyanax mexicanus]
MTGGSENAAGEKDGGPTLTAQVPVGWQRKVEDGAVSYVSPSGTVLCSVEEVRVYLLTDSTCKCGLECPLVLHKVFNFDPAAVVQAPSHQSGKIEEDMTKLCNHRRKVVAMAALCRSMQSSQIPLPAHGTGSVVVCSVDGREPRGSIVARGDMGHCTYLTQPRLNQPRPSSSSSFPVPSPVSLLQNGSVSQPTSVLTSDQSSPLKRPHAQSPGLSIAAYGKQQWSPHPAISQAILQRAPHKPPSPSTTKFDTHTPAYQQDLPISFSSPPSSSSPVFSRAGQSHLQGTIVKSPSPLSVSSSPSCARDSFSPHQRSRHSSTSSLSEGAPGSVLCHAQGVKPPQSPLHSSHPSSPKLLLPHASPCLRQEGVFQQYKECSTNTNINSTQHHNALSNQSNLHAPQNPQLAHSSHCDRRNGSGASAPSPGLLGLPLGQILCQQKSQQQHISSSFPASSLLSAAAKAQLASQKSQNQSGAAEATAALPVLDKDQQSKVLISTLNSSLHAPAGRAQSLTAFLLPHSSSISMTPHTLTEKTLRRKRQRRSPTVLSMLKESQMNRTTGDQTASSLLVPSPSSSSSCSSPPPLPLSENHLINSRLSGAPSASSNSVVRQPEWEEGKKTVLANPLPLSSPSASSQPLSALLQLLSMQSAQNASQSNSTTTPAVPSRQSIALPPSSPNPITSQTPNYDSHVHMQQQSQHHNLVPSLDHLAQLPTSHPIPLMSEDTDGAAVNLKTTPNTGVLNLSQPHLGKSAGAETSVNSQTPGVMSQPNSASCLRSPTHPEKSCASKPGEMDSDHNIYQTNQTNQSSHNHPIENEGPVLPEEPQNLETRLLTGCDPDPSLPHPPAPTAPSADLPSSPTDPTNALQLAESFPFMTQEQLLQLLSSTAGLPSLLPPFLGSLPLGLWTGGQPPTTGNVTQPPPPTNNLLSQAPAPLNILPSTLGAQGEFPLNLISLLNPPAPAPGLEVGEKNPGLQALLMASLLLGQNPAAILPLPGLNLELPPPQQVFGEGVSLEKTPAPLLDSVLMGPGLLEALQALAPPADGQSLLLSAQLTPPPPPAFLSLNPTLLAAALAQAETLPNHTPSPPPHTQGSLSSPALVSTSMSCTPLLPVSGQEVCDSLTEQEKTNTQTPPPFLPPLLPPGVLGDLTALGNINSLHSLLGAGHLLLPQAPSLGMPLPQNQAGLNPLTCLQLSMAPALMGEKPLALHETNQTQEDIPPSQLSQDSLLNPGHVQTPAQQREESAGVTESGLLDPYGSFMDTIYTSFLQVSGRGSEGGTDSTPLSYPELPPLLQQPSGPPSLSPRRACSVHNPDLSRLSMEAAQSPARGTPKLTEDPSTPPPSKPAGADACPADAPLHLTFMEEAKTDGSSKLCVYSNGIGSGVGAGDDEDEDDEEDDEVERQPQGYLSPRERGTSDTMDQTMGNADTEQGRATEIRTGARRGRKRKQTLQRGTEIPVEIDSIIEEPAATIALPRPARAARGKRRRVVR